MCQYHFLWKHYLIFQTGSTIPSSVTPIISLQVPLAPSPLQVYQQRKKITINVDNLPPHQSTTSTEVSELPIALRKSIHSCTQHSIDKVLSFSHLSLTFFNFATKFLLSSKILSWCYVRPYIKNGMDKEMTIFHANETWELTLLPPEK